MDLNLELTEDQVAEVIKQLNPEQRKQLTKGISFDADEILEMIWKLPEEERERISNKLRVSEIEK